MAGTPLIDSFGRVHDNLRISVTDRCNIRCFYCMPEDDVHFVERREILDFEEIERFARIAVGLGIRKLRVTGGEPLVRRDLPVLIRRLVSIPGIKDLALTTNGVLLEEMAQPLYEAGLRRINALLDTLDRERFLKIPRRDDLGRVLAGIDAAQESPHFFGGSYRNQLDPAIVVQDMKLMSRNQSERFPHRFGNNDLEFGR